MYVKNLKILPPISKCRALVLGLVYLHLPLESQAASSLESLLDLSLDELMNVTVVSLFDETQLEASSSVKIVNEQDWQKNAARRTNEIMTYQPSTVAYPFLGGSNAFAIRGYSNTLSARGVSTLLDGVPLNTYSFGTAQYFLANFDIGSLSRAELIRGPGSAIYGTDAFHGVFSLSTYASKEDALETEIGLGSPGYARAHARFSQGVGDGSRLFGAVASTKSGDADIIFETSTPGVQGEREDAYISRTVFLRSESKLNEQWEADWGVYYNSWNGDQFPSFGESTLGENDVSDGEQEFYMLTANIKYSLNNRNSLEVKSFIWNTEQRFDYVFPAVPFQEQEDRRYGVTAIYKDTGSKTDPRWLIGVGIDKTKVVSTEVSTGVQAFDGLERSINNLFADYRHSLDGGKLLLGAGLRVDDYSDFGSHVTPRLSMIYMLEDTEAIKLLYGNAFRAPVASEVTSSGTIQGNPALMPETIDTLELVWMKQEQMYSYNVTLFSSEWKDAIIIVNDTGLPAPFTRRYENQGKFQSKGLELELTRLFEQWHLDGSYAFVQSEDMQKGEDFIAFPEHILQIGIDTAINDVTDFRLYNAAYFAMHANPDPTAEKLETIWQVNMNINVKWGKDTEVAFDIRNLLNHKDPVPSLWGNEQGLPVEGIQFSAYLRMKF